MEIRTEQSIKNDGLQKRSTGGKGGKSSVKHTDLDHTWPMMSATLRTGLPP